MRNVYFKKYLILPKPMALEAFICFTSFSLIIPPSAIVFGKISQISFNSSIPRPVLPFELNIGEKVI